MTWTGTLKRFRIETEKFRILASVLFTRGDRLTGSLVAKLAQVKQSYPLHSTPKADKLQRQTVDVNSKCLC